jgi:putative peptidoglycan binding protein/L,D-transpeptidase-like protein
MRRGLVVITLVFAALALPAPAFASLSIGSAGPAVHQLQKKLIKLRYLGPGGLTGVYSARTSQAVMAFQGWVGLTRDGVAGTTTLRRLRKADHRPIPWSRVYKHVEVHKDRQVALLIGKGGKTVRAIHVSTAAPGHVTPSGHFRIYRKELMSWSKPPVPLCARIPRLPRMHPHLRPRRDRHVPLRDPGHARRHPVGRP